MKTKEKKDIVFLLDRSGSMGGCVDDTIGGYNSYIKDNKKNDCLVTTILFDDQYEMLNDRVDIKEIKKLTNKEYYVRGCTALLDAIGKSINYMDSKKRKKVMFVITTDGYENASREFKKEQIKEMIEKHPDWEFIYIGADIDSYAEASAIGIKHNNIANYKKSKKGINTLFASVGKASSCFFNEECLDASWKQELDEFIDDNIE